MITILATNDPTQVVAVGERAVVDVLPVTRLPRDWHARAAPNVLGPGAMGLARAAADLVGLRLACPSQTVQLQDWELAPPPMAADRLGVGTVPPAAEEVRRAP
jgi:hypothetical protein